MPHVSKFARLPAHIQREIEARLIRNGFSGYRALAAELKRRGFSIGRSSLNAEGKAIKARIESLRDERFSRLAGLTDVVERDKQ